MTIGISIDNAHQLKRAFAMAGRGDHFKDYEHLFEIINQPDEAQRNIDIEELCGCYMEYDSIDDIVKDYGVTSLSRSEILRNLKKQAHFYKSKSSIFIRYYEV